MDNPLVVLILILVALASSLGVYVWSSWALSRVFHQLGTDGWRGWVPVLNEMTIFERGGVAPWKVVFYLVPVVQLYAVYLKFEAARRIGDRYRRDTGFAVLAVLVTPVWATMLGARGNPDAGAAQPRISSVVGHRQMAGGMTGAPQPAGTPGTPGTPPPPPPPPTAAQPRAAAPLPGAPAPDLAAPPAPTPSVPAAPLAADPAVNVQVPPPSPMPEPAPPEAPISSEVATSAPILVHNPWARPAPPEATTAEPGTPPSSPSTEVPAWLDTPAGASAAVVPPMDDDEDDAATIVVDRRPHVQWHLNVDGASPLPLAGEHIVLGRRPAASSPGLRALPVPDTTRTLSKSHARLDLVDGEWTITDLDSTNGVLIVDDAGEEKLITPGEAVPVTGRFILGKVGMHISFEQAGA